MQNSESTVQISNFTRTRSDIEYARSGVPFRSGHCSSRRQSAEKIVWFDAFHWTPKDLVHLVAISSRLYEGLSLHYTPERPLLGLNSTFGDVLVRIVSTGRQKGKGN